MIKLKSLSFSTMKVKTLSFFRNEFVDETMLSLIEAMFETISALLLINSSICFSRAICNYSFKNDLRINCVYCDTNITFFNIILINKRKD